MYIFGYLMYIIIKRISKLCRHFSFFSFFYLFFLLLNIIIGCPISVKDFFCYFFCHIIITIIN